MTRNVRHLRASAIVLGLLCSPAAFLPLLAQETTRTGTPPQSRSRAS